MTEQYFRLRESVLLRDESQFFGKGYHLVVDLAARKSWLVDRLTYELASFLCQPHTTAEISQHQAILAVSYPQELFSQLKAEFAVLQQVGLVTPVTPAVPAVPQPNLSIVADDWRYLPLRSPIAITVAVPLDEEIFSRLIVECNQLGTVTLTLLGGQPTAVFLAAHQGSLTGARSILQLPLTAEDVLALGQPVFAGLRNHWGSPPVVILETAGESATLGAANSLIDQAVPFSIKYQLADDLTSEALEKLLQQLLAYPAKEVRLILQPTAAGNLDNIASQFRRLRAWQHKLADQRLQIQVCQVPVPPPYSAYGLTAKRLLTGLMAGCPVGEVPYHPNSTAILIPSPEQAAEQGFELPPNCCPAGLSHLAIAGDGAVYPCEMAFGVPELEIGNLRDTTLRQLWSHERWRFFRGGWELYQLAGCYGCARYVGCKLSRISVIPWPRQPRVCAKPSSLMYQAIMCVGY